MSNKLDGLARSIQVKLSRHAQAIGVDPESSAMASPSFTAFTERAMASTQARRAWERGMRSWQLVLRPRSPFFCLRPTKPIQAPDHLFRDSR